MGALTLADLQTSPLSFGARSFSRYIDVDDLGAVLHLLACHVERGVEIAIEDETLEARGAGDVGTLADVDEAGLWGHGCDNCWLMVVQIRTARGVHE